MNTIANTRLVVFTLLVGMVTALACSSSSSSSTVHQDASTQVGGASASSSTGGTGTGGQTTTVASSGGSSSGGAVGGSTGTIDGGASTTGFVTIHNDFFWYDTDGNLINVRSGALRKFGDLYYWYGGAQNDHNQTCYSSPDLVHWTYKGIVLTTTGDANRMDILYNATTKQYVIFLKYIGNSAYLGIATG